MENEKVVNVTKEQLMEMLDKKKEELEVINAKQQIFYKKQQLLLDESLVDIKDKWFRTLPKEIIIKITEHNVRFFMKHPDYTYDKDIFEINVSKPWRKKEEEIKFEISLGYYTTTTEAEDIFELIRLETLGTVATLLRNSEFKKDIILAYEKHEKFSNDNYVSTWDIEHEITDLKNEYNEIVFQKKLIPGIIWEITRKEDGERGGKRFFYNSSNNYWCTKMEIVKINAKTVEVKFTISGGYDCTEKVRYEHMKGIFNKIKEINEKIANEVIEKMEVK